MKSLFFIFIIYSSISLGDLHKKGMEIYNLLKTKKLILARNKLSFIVGRETKKLKEKEIIRAAIETISENIVDGITSPIFFALIGGAPLAILFKTVSTLDSMVGYKNKQYKNLAGLAQNLMILKFYTGKDNSVYNCNFIYIYEKKF